MKQTRMKTEARKEDILAAALPLAERHGYTNITRDQIAAAAKVSGPTLHYHFGTIAQLRRDLMRYAVREVCLRVIAQGLMIRDPQAMKAGAELRRQAMGSVSDC
jgi:AcrR family transcriptional regulator